MKTRRAWLAVVVLFVLGLGVSASQGAGFTTKDSDCKFNTITIGGEKWGELRVRYTTLTKSKWVDSLTVDFYLAAMPDSRVSGIEKPQPVLFHKQVTYVDIENGNHDAVTYLHFSPFERYITSTSKAKYAVVFSVKSEVLAVVGSEKDPDSKWWENEGFMLKAGYLMSRDESPFYDQSPSNYEMIQPKER
jgi:hypothetical protein